MKKYLKPTVAFLLVFVMLLCFAACGNRSGNASDKAEEPASLNQSEYDEFMETYAPPGVVTDVKSAIIGDWYLRGFYNKGYPQGSLSYEPSLSFYSDGTFRVFRSDNSEYQSEYRIDDANTLFIEGRAHSYSSEARHDTWYLENYDGLELTFEGGKFVKEFPKGELFEKIIGSWEPEGEYGSVFDKITFYDDGSVVWIARGEEEEETGTFAINEYDRLLYIDGFREPFFVWDLSQSRRTYTYGEGWDEEKESYYTWGFSDFGNSYNLIFSGVSYQKTAE